MRGASEGSREFNDAGEAEGGSPSEAGFWLSSFGHVKALADAIQDLDQAVDFSEDTGYVLDTLRGLMPVGQPLPEKLLIPQEVLMRIFSSADTVYLREMQRGILPVLKEEMGNKIGSIRTTAKLVRDYGGLGDESKVAQKVGKLDEYLTMTESQAASVRMIGELLYARAREARERMEREGTGDDIENKDFQMVHDYRSLRSQMVGLSEMQEFFGEGGNLQVGLGEV